MELLEIKDVYEVYVYVIAYSLSEYTINLMIIQY